MNTSLRGSPRLLQCTLRLAKAKCGSSLSQQQQQQQQQHLIASLGRLEQVALSSTWSHARSLRSGARSNHRQHRPLGANGEAVAMHIKDLQQQRLSFYPNAATTTTTPHRDYESDLIVILDMDECLIHSKFLSTPGAKYAHQLLQQQQQQQQQLQEHERSVESFRVTLPDGDLVHVNKRPFLDEFLQHVTSRYETHVFTAAMEIYAKPVLDVLDPTGTMFAKRWYRETCSYDATNDAYVKNLHRLFATPDQHRRVVLVDNNPFSFLANPSNGILVSSFYNDPKDTTLLTVMQLLEELHPQEDVRPVLEERFGLKNALLQIQNSQQARTAGKSLTSATTQTSATTTTVPPLVWTTTKPAATLLY